MFDIYGPNLREKVLSTTLYINWNSADNYQDDYITLDLEEGDRCRGEQPLINYIEEAFLFPYDEDDLDFIAEYNISLSGVSLTSESIDYFIFNHPIYIEDLNFKDQKIFEHRVKRPKFMKELL